MSLYYFHLRDDAGLLRDPEGSDLPDLEAARVRALKAARSILSAEALDGLIRFDMGIEVEDGTGACVHRLPFSAAARILRLRQRPMPA